MLAKEWVGIATLRTLVKSNRSLVILGEHHSSAAHHDEVVKNLHHAANGVIEYLQSTEHHPVHIYIELSAANEEHVRMADKLMLDKAAYLAKINTCFSTIERLFNYSMIGELPSATLHYCNVRDSPPFSVFYLLANPPAFADLHASILETRYPLKSKRQAFIRKLVKSLESAFTTHVRSKEDTISFWMSLVSPDVPTPTWYDAVCEEAMGRTNNMVKLRLEMVRQEHPASYTKLIESYELFLRAFLAQQMQHSRVLSKIKRRVNRREAKLSVSKTPIMMNDFKHIGDYFGTMLAFIQDIYMIAQYIGVKNTAHHHLFICGDLHTSFLGHFLKTDKYWSCESGDLVIRPTAESAKPNPPFAMDFSQYLTTYLAMPSV